MPKELQLLVEREETLEHRGRRLLAEQLLKEVKLPGWYRDCRGILCITVQGWLISLFVNDEDCTYDVTVDGADDKGCLSDNVFWESYSEWKTAVERGFTLFRELSKGNLKVLRD